MYVVNGIAYVGEPDPVLKVNGVRPMNDFKLRVRFSTGEAKIFDFKPFFNTPAFAPLADKNVFDEVLY